MSNQDDPNSKKPKGDLTSLFDLSDFDHEEDPEAEAYFQEKAEEDKDESEDDNTLEHSELTQTEFNPQDIFDDQVNELDDEQSGFEENDFGTDFEDFEQVVEEEEKEEKDEPLEEFETEDHSFDAVEIATAATAIADESTTHYEKFDDIQKFAKNSHYAPVTAKGEPPFTMIIENVKYKEDANKVLAILKEYGFLNQSNEHIITKGLERGSTIISRVSEFAVIFLYSKLSQLPIKLKVGPSDLIFPSSSSQSTHQGSVSTDHLLQNREDSKSLRNDEATSILFSSQSEIQGYIIQDFLGHCFETIEFQAYPEAGELEQSIDQLQNREIFIEMKNKVISALKLKLQEIDANAGVDFEVQTQALFTEEKQDYTYQITAKCNAVWIKKT